MPVSDRFLGGGLCIDWQECLHAEGGRTEGSSCPLGHVRSVCTSIERVAGSVGPLLEPATAAAVRPPGADLTSLCTGNLAGLDERDALLCLHFLNPFLKEPFRAAFVEGRVTASTVRALCLICTIVVAVTNLTTRGTSLPSSARIFAMTKLLAFEAAQWVRYIY